MNGIVSSHVDRYLALLGVHTRPVIKIRDNIGSSWLGRCRWSASSPGNTVIELQRSILGHDRTLERVIAHEIIHHRDSISMSQATRTLLGLGIRPDGHGPTFLEGAAKINAVMGEGFVTKTSDRQYEQAAPTRSFLVLIFPHPITDAPNPSRFGWNWAVRLGPRAKEYALRYIAQGARLVRSQDIRWTRGAKIERFGGYSLPIGPENAAALRALYETAPSVSIEEIS